MFSPKSFFLEEKKLFTRKILFHKKTHLTTQYATKLKKSNCDKTKKLKFLQNSKTQIVTKLKL